MRQIRDHAVAHRAQGARRLARQLSDRGTPRPPRRALQRPSEPQAVAQPFGAISSASPRLHHARVDFPDGNVASGELTESSCTASSAARLSSDHVPASSVSPHRVVPVAGGPRRWRLLAVLRCEGRTRQSHPPPRDRRDDRGVPASEGSAAEYANSPEHARFLTHELLPQLEAEFPLVGNRSGRGLLGASFGAVAHCRRRTDRHGRTDLWYSCRARLSLPTPEPTTAVAASSIRW